MEVRSHGWSGNAPASDDEAISRILDASEAIIADSAATLRIADLARSLGVTRQTIYRYFPGTDAILMAIALRSADGFLDRLAKRVRGIHDPVTAMVEGMVFGVDTLSKDERLAMMLTGDATSITSDTAIAFGRALLRRFDVEWEVHGFADRDLNELAEFTLRLLHSYLVDPGPVPRSADGLREFLMRWVGPAIAYPRIRDAFDSVGAIAAPRSERKR